MPTLEDWQIAPYYQPAREVGGVFYDFLEFPNEHLVAVVGDATGKGVPAALLMSTTCGILRAVALSVDSPGEVLERVNETLVARIPPTCSSPASTPSLSLQAVASPTPTPATTCPLCAPW